MFDPARPFVLLDDVAAGTARLFTGIVETVVAAEPDDVAPAIDRLRAPGPWVGFIGFEAGYSLEARLKPLARAAPDGQPLLWFGRFAEDAPLAGEAVARLLGDGPAAVGAAIPGLERGDYDARLARVQALIAAGDIYQANLTFAASVATGGHPLHLYARLRAGSRAPFGALVFTGSLWLLSFSPELFFRLDGRRLMARPMKGTAARGHHAADDSPTAYSLAFGQGLHRCLGAKLAELETITVLEETARAFPTLVLAEPDPEWIRLLSFQTPKTVMAALAPA